MSAIKSEEINAGPEESQEAQEIDGADNLVELVLAAHEERMIEQFSLPDRIDGIVVGIVRGFGAEGEVNIDLPGFYQAQNLCARALCALSEADVGREAAILFEGGNTKRPVIMGLLYAGGEKPQRPPVFERTRSKASVDGERLVFSADREIVLQCGEASITLTRAGKILIRGAYVLTRSSGVNRIQGGSVQIN